MLLSVASRLSDLDRPVTARGVVLVEGLLVDVSGPLYDRERRGSSRFSRRGPRRAGATLMVELLGIVIAVVCFLAAFGLIVLLDRV